MENSVYLETCQRMLLQTLDAFDHFCRDHNIRYFAAYGTALGAVRHQGFIPWDDDLDVYLLREDYERLLALRDDPALAGRYEILAPGYKDYVLPYAKFSNANSTLIEDLRWPFVQGVFLDLFPLDSVPSEGVERLQDRASRRFARYRRSVRRHPSFSLQAVGDAFYRLFRRAWFRAWEREMGRIRRIGGPCRTVLTRRDCEEREVMPEAWFAVAMDLPFESGTIMTMDAVRDYLSAIYGDYMQLPPPEKRHSTHNLYYVDFNTRTLPPALR